MPSLIQTAGAIYIISVVLQRQISKGTVFRKLSKDYRATDLRFMASQVPIPMFTTVQNGFIRILFEAGRSSARTIFDGQTRSVEEFLRQLTSRGTELGERRPSKAALIFMVVLLDRLFVRCPSMFLHKYNFINLMAASYSVSIKVLDDVNWGLGTVSRMAMVKWRDLWKLEAAFLVLIDYDVHVNVEQFKQAETVLMARALEGELGLEMLDLIEHLGIGGVDKAMSIARGWEEVIGVGEPGGSGVYEGYICCGEDRLWCMVSMDNSLGSEGEIRNRITELSLAIYKAEFANISLRLSCKEAELRVWEGCEAAGVDRFLVLRRIILHHDYSNTHLKSFSARPGTRRLWAYSRKRLEEGFLNGLGRNGRELVRKDWDVRLVPPDLYEGDVNDREHDSRDRSSSSFTAHSTDGSFTSENQSDAESDEFGYSYLDGYRISNGGLPCTPVGERGGSVPVKLIPFIPFVGLDGET